MVNSIKQSFLPGKSVVAKLPQKYSALKSHPVAKFSLNTTHNGRHPPFSVSPQTVNSAADKKRCAYKRREDVTPVSECIR